MPFKEKALADDQHQPASGAVQAEDILHQLTHEHAEGVVHQFAPKSYIEKTHHEQRVEQQNQKKKWLETIMQRHNNLQLTKIKIQEMAKSPNPINAPLIGTAPLKSGGGHGM